MRKRVITVLGTMLLFTTAGCVDLNVTNPNQPGIQVSSSPTGLESLIAGSFHVYFQTNTSNGGVYSYYGPVMAMGTMSNRWSSSWGNSGMKDLSSEPRAGIDNNPAYSSAYAIEDGWYPPYQAIRLASDGLRSIAKGTKIIASDGTDNTVRAEAWGEFVEGLSLGWLSALYDKAFIFDNNTPVDASGSPTGTMSLSPYPQVEAAAIGHLQKVIDLSTSNSFTIPSSWAGNSGDVSSAELAQLAHSYIARYMVEDARDSTELAAVNWDSVMTNVDEGITSDWGPVGDGFQYWENDLMYYSTQPTWARADLQILGMADQSGNYQTWMADNLDNRRPFLIDTDDWRVKCTEDANGVCTGDAAASDTVGGSEAAWYPTVPFRPERGYYHFSNYGWVKWLDYMGSGTGPMPIISVAEMQLYKAEALINLGQPAAAAAIINQTRVADGHLPPVGVDGDQSARCVPRLPDGNCGNLMDALRWEFYLETQGIGAGVFYFNERGWNQLVTNTPVQFPVPGKQLQSLSLPIYSFGGPGGNSSAPGGIFGNYSPGASVGAGFGMPTSSGQMFRASDVLASLAAFDGTPHARLPAPAIIPH